MKNTFKPVTVEADTHICRFVGWYHHHHHHCCTQDHQHHQSTSCSMINTCLELYVYTAELWSDVIILFVFLSRNFMKCLLTWPCWSKTRWVASSTTADMIKLLRKVKSAHEPEGYFEHSFFSNSVRESY